MHVKCAGNFDLLTVLCFVCLKNCMIQIICKHLISWYCQNCSVTLGRNNFQTTHVEVLMHLIPWHWNIHHVNWKVICPRDFLYPRKRVSIWSVIWMLDCVIVIVYLCYNWLQINTWTFGFFLPFPFRNCSESFPLIQFMFVEKKTALAFFLIHWNKNMQDLLTLGGVPLLLNLDQCGGMCNKYVLSLFQRV